MYKNKFQRGTLIADIPVASRINTNYLSAKPLKSS